jgi:hypothetical protein
VKTEDECKLILKIHNVFQKDLYRQNRLIEAFTKLMKLNEKESFDKGYEAGRWDRPTNTSGRI